MTTYAETLLCILLATFFWSNTFAQGKVVVNISNIRSDKGLCRACIFNNAASFNGEGGQPYKCANASVRNKNAQIVFENIPAGQYAVFVFHDENNNNKMDRNFLGIPKEGYGASQNKLPFALAPGYKENMFVVGPTTASVNLNIKLRNL